MNNYNDSQFINVGTGIEHSIQSVANIIKSKIGFSGDLKFNKSYPNGTNRKLLDVSRINKLGWKSSILFEDGIDRILSDIELELKKYL